MYEPDYIMRTIKQFSEMLAAILFGATNGQVTLDDLEELSVTFTGLSLGTLTALGTPQLLTLYSVIGTLDIDKAYVSARLLYQLAEQEGEASRALMLKEKALALSLEVRRVLGGFLNDEHESLVQELQVSVAKNGT